MTFNSGSRHEHKHVTKLFSELLSRAEILVGRRSSPDQEKCGPDRVICLAPDQ